MTSPTATSDIYAAIDAANHEFMNAFRRGDPAGIAALYTGTASVLPPQHEIVEGPAAIERFWHDILQLGVAEAELETRDIDARDDLAYEVGRYTMRTAEGQPADQGKYIVIWKRVGDRWKLHCDTWNTDLTPKQ